MKGHSVPAVPSSLTVENSASAIRTRVAICIATYRRPLMLRGLLDSVRALAFPLDAAPEVRVIVVDNDASQSAKLVIDAAHSALPWPIDYLLEPRRNIAMARNRGVAQALAWSADFVAFVDDDEQVSPAWLDALLSVQRAYAADIVHGPVERLLPEDTPVWLREGGDFGRKPYRTGDRLVYADTSNVLVDARLLADDRPGPFDAAFGLSGGEDTHFFLRCQRNGARLVWANDAVVEEYTSTDRARWEWLVQRSYREGNAALHCERALPPGARRTATQVLRAIYRLGGGLLAGLCIPFQGRAAALRALRHFAYAAGTFAALVGHRYLEYAGAGWD